MIRALDLAILWICRLSGLIAALTIVVLAGLVAASIVSRLMGVYVAGLTDYSAYCLAVAAAFGMAYAFGAHGHIRVELLVDQLQGGVRYCLEVGVLAVATAMVAYLAWYLVRMTFVSLDFQDRSDGSDEILIWIPQAPFAVGFTLFAVVLVLALLRAILRRDLKGLAAERIAKSWD